MRLAHIFALHGPFQFGAEIGASFRRQRLLANVFGSWTINSYHLGAFRSNDSKPVPIGRRCTFASLDLTAEGLRDPSTVRRKSAPTGPRLCPVLLTGSTAETSNDRSAWCQDGAPVVVRFPLLMGEGRERAGRGRTTCHILPAIAEIRR